MSDEDEVPDSYRQTTCEITAGKVFGEFVINAHLEYYYKMTHDYIATHTTDIKTLTMEIGSKVV